MSNDQKPPLNLYGILDNEMSRMHVLLQAYLSTSSQSVSYNSPHPYTAAQTARDIYDRILMMQDMLLKAVIAHDLVLQEKIAELALTETADVDKR